MADSDHQGEDGERAEAEQAPMAEAHAEIEKKAPGLDHVSGTHAHPGGVAPHPPAHKPNVREYLVIFVVLAVLTVLEVAVAKVPGISRRLVGLALVGLALTKAGFVALYYMHLKSETRVLKMTVAIPMAAPTIYALVLISEAAWRLTR